MQAQVKLLSNNAMLMKFFFVLHSSTKCRVLKVIPRESLTNASMNQLSSSKINELKSYITNYLLLISRVASQLVAISVSTFVYFEIIFPLKIKLFFCFLRFEELFTVKKAFYL